MPNLLARRQILRLCPKLANLLSNLGLSKFLNLSNPSFTNGCNEKSLIKFKGIHSRVYPGFSINTLHLLPNMTRVHWALVQEEKNSPQTSRWRKDPPCGICEMHQWITKAQKEEVTPEALQVHCEEKGSFWCWCVISTMCKHHLGSGGQQMVELWSGRGRALRICCTHGRAAAALPKGRDTELPSAKLCWAALHTATRSRAGQEFGIHSTAPRVGGFILTGRALLVSSGHGMWHGGQSSKSSSSTRLPANYFICLAFPFLKWWQQHSQHTQSAPHRQWCCRQPWNLQGAGPCCSLGSLPCHLPTGWCLLSLNTSAWLTWNTRHADELTQYTVISKLALLQWNLPHWAILVITLFSAFCYANSILLSSDGKRVSHTVLLREHIRNGFVQNILVCKWAIKRT